MSRLEWLLLFLVFVVYVVLGGVVLMHLEGQHEQVQRAADKEETRQLQGAPLGDLNARFLPPRPPFCPSGIC
jgi:hypothetical protein